MKSFDRSIKQPRARTGRYDELVEMYHAAYLDRSGNMSDLFVLCNRQDTHRTTLLRCRGGANSRYRQVVSGGSSCT